MPNKIDNLRIKNLHPLISPDFLKNEISVTPQIQKIISTTRTAIVNILNGIDNRLLVIIGPCSIHDPHAAMDYAKRLLLLKNQFENELCILMRVYFEKPRTTVGWKGLINDPDLNNSFNINKGLHIARQLLWDINALGLATGSEFLDTIIPQYLSDLTSWSAIGARTTESQTHRELASGLSMPVGFKNNTMGNREVAVDAVYAAAHPHHFLGVTKEGVAAIVSTAGNPHCHVILRGSNEKPNYDIESIQYTADLLVRKKLKQKIMIDCSHGNSQKNYQKQIQVIQEICNQIINADSPIFGVMVESNLIEGRQELTDKKDLIYGQSITDACIGWTETETMLKQLQRAVMQKNKFLLCNHE